MRFLFVFKQKTAYEMRIRDWSSDVCSSDLRAAGTTFPVRIAPRRPGDVRAVISDVSRLRAAFDWKPAHDSLDEILRTALAWERTCAAGARGADATPPPPSWP